MKLKIMQIVLYIPSLNGYVLESLDSTMWLTRDGSLTTDMAHALIVYDPDAVKTCKAFASKHGYIGMRGIAIAIYFVLFVLGLISILALWARGLTMLN